MGWNGAGGWVIFSHDRQVNFSRTVWITFHCRGITSSVSVTSSPSLTSLPWQHGQTEGAGMMTRSRGRCAGNGARAGLRRVMPRAALSSRPAFLAAAASVASSAAQVSSVAVASSSSSCNSNWSSSRRRCSEDGPNRSRFSLAIRSFRCATIASAPEARASACLRAPLGKERRFQRLEVVGNGIGWGAHKASNAIWPFDFGENRAGCTSPRSQPARCGRKV